ncbi:MAG: hypothetical protein ABL925_14145 [Methylococcales bacterium]
MHQKYAESKKARRIAAIVYLLFMGFIFTGTYLSQQQKEAVAQQTQNVSGN